VLREKAPPGELKIQDILRYFSAPFMTIPVEIAISGPKSSLVLPFSGRPDHRIARCPRRFGQDPKGAIAAR
jgi:hypothetical protein